MIWHLIIQNTQLTGITQRANSSHSASVDCVFGHAQTSPTTTSPAGWLEASRHPWVSNSGCCLLTWSSDTSFPTAYPELLEASFAKRLLGSQPACLPAVKNGSYEMEMVPPGMWAVLWHSQWRGFGCWFLSVWNQGRVISLGFWVIWFSMNADNNAFILGMQKNTQAYLF